MKRQRSFGTTLTMAGALAAVTVLAAGQPAEEEAADAPRVMPVTEDAANRVGDTRPGSSGLRVHLDPETGQMRNRPADPDAAVDPGGLGDRFNTYGGDLLQEPLPDGGFKVDLRGRFRSAVVATIDPQSDEVTIDCVSTPATKEVGDAQ